MYKSKYLKQSDYFYNNKYCDKSHQCFSSINLNNIEQMCGNCATEEEYCSITLEFDY